MIICFEKMKISIFRVKHGRSKIHLFTYFNAKISYLNGKWIHFKVNFSINRMSSTIYTLHLIGIRCKNFKASFQNQAWLNHFSNTSMNWWVSCYNFSLRNQFFNYTCDRAHFMKRLRLICSCFSNRNHSNK